MAWMGYVCLGLSLANICIALVNFRFAAEFGNRAGNVYAAFFSLFAAAFCAFVGFDILGMW